MGLFESTITLLKESGLSDPDIEKETGLSKRWLNKLRNDEITGHMIVRIEDLNKYLKKEQRKQSKESKK